MNKKRKKIRLDTSQLLLVFAGMIFGIVPAMIGFVMWKRRRQNAARN